VADALFDDSSSFNNWFADLVAIFSLGDFEACFVDG
jgi:hypothetical protein